MADGKNAEFLGNWKCTDERGMDMTYKFESNTNLTLRHFIGETPATYKFNPEKGHMDISFKTQTGDDMTLACWYEYSKTGDAEKFILWTPKTTEANADVSQLSSRTANPKNECEMLVCSRFDDSEFSPETEPERALKAVAEIKEFVMTRIASIAMYDPSTEEEVMALAISDHEVQKAMAKIPMKHGLHHQRMEELQSDPKLAAAFAEMDRSIMEAVQRVVRGEPAILPAEKPKKKNKKDKKAAKKDKKDKKDKKKDKNKETGADKPEESEGSYTGIVIAAATTVLAVAAGFLYWRRTQSGEPASNR